MVQSIFSTYSQGENRVTSTIVAVLRGLPVNVLEQFLVMFTGEDSKAFFTFQDQIKSGTEVANSTSNSVPDAKIAANFNILFETKTKQNAIDKPQLLKHLKKAEIEGATLIYLTPDLEKPKELEGKELVWKSFQDIYDLILELFDDPTLILSERDQFLLRNLQEFFDQSGLLPIKDEVVVIAANVAWPTYQKHGVYVCQAGRSFRNTNYLAFYAQGAVQVTIPEIKGAFTDFDFSEGWTAKYVSLDLKLRGWLKDNEWAKGQTLQVIDLSMESDSETKKIDAKIPNNILSKVGKKTAYTQGQRYTTLDKLQEAKTTSDLQ